MGAEVYPGKEKEIGWHQLQFLPAVGGYKIWSDHPGAPMVFHWHHDTFDIPSDAVRIASSAAFDNQGFIYKEQVVALQFHLEVTKESVRELIENCREDMVPGPHVQTEEEIMNFPDTVEGNIHLMAGILQWLMKR
jgi:GMP synthase (glutamine-hydrolysing)